VVGGCRSINTCPPNLLTRQYKDQPEREYLENGENPEFRQIKNNAQNQNCPKIPSNVGKQRGQKTKSKTVPF